MKKTLILSALIFSAAGAPAQELPEGLPGLGGDPAQTGIQRPDAKRIMSELSPALRLSSKQEERIGGAIAKKSREFDKLLKEYDKTAAEERRWHEKVEGLKSKLRNINSSLPDVIRGYLDDEQEQNFEAMLEARQKGAAGGRVKEGEAPGPRPGRKKKLVKKKKKKAGPPAEEGAAPPAGPEGAAAAGPAEEEPGTTMVDDEKSAEPAARKKKKVKKKAKAAPPPEAPEESPPAGEPEDAAPAGPDAPEEEEGGDAGSYP